MPVFPAIGAALGASAASAAAVGGLAVAGTAATVGGAVISAGASKKAANVQAQAAKDALNASNAQYNNQVALQEPFRQAGLTAQNQYMNLLGLNNPNAAPAPTGPEAYGLRAVNTPSYGGDGGFGGFGGATSYVDAQGNPVADVNAYMAANPLPAAAPSADFGKYARDFGTADFEADPGYAFRQSEGMKALERSAAARGNLLSGSSMKGIQRFGQDLASQEYTNAFNRYQVNRSNQLNPLQSLMGSGQSATNTLTSASANQGTNQANLIQQAGQARASGYVGSANALNTALGSIGSMAINQPSTNAMNNYLMNRIYPYGGGGGYGGGGYGGGGGFILNTGQGPAPNYINGGN
jgi:hypothetical protein